jgi:hypothetical protein
MSCDAPDFAALPKGHELPQRVQKQRSGRAVCGRSVRAPRVRRRARAQANPQGKKRKFFMIRCGGRNGERHIRKGLRRRASNVSGGRWHGAAARAEGRPRAPLAGSSALRCIRMPACALRHIGCAEPTRMLVTGPHFSANLSTPKVRLQSRSSGCLRPNPPGIQDADQTRNELSGRRLVFSRTPQNLAVDHQFPRAWMVQTSWNRHMPAHFTTPPERNETLLAIHRSDAHFGKVGVSAGGLAGHPR